MFHGGENDLLPANQIDDNEVAKLTNLIAGLDGEPLKVRGGTALYTDLNLGEPLVSAYRFSRSKAAALGSEFDLIATPTRVFRLNTDKTATLMFTWATAGQETRFCTLLNCVFAMNGVDTPKVWDGGEGGFVDLYDHSAAPAVPAPKLRYAMSFRGRLWGVDDNGYVRFSGVNDAQYEVVPNTTPKTYYKRYETWGGTLESDGGYLNVGDDDGQKVTGIGFLYNGVIVFKERSIYLWSYSEDNHPADVKTNSVEVLVPAVGCASQDTIQYKDGAMLFLGQNQRSEYAVYRLLGQGIDDVSVKIPRALKRVVANSSSNPRATIYDHYYIIAADDADESGASRTLVYALDLKRNCWFEVDGWNVGGFTYNKERDKLWVLSGADSKIVEYPTGTTDNGAPINWRVTFREVDGGNALQDHKWRHAWVDIKASKAVVNVGVSVDGSYETVHTVTVDKDDLDSWELDDAGVFAADVYDMWDDGTDWYQGSAQSSVMVPLSDRSRLVQLSAFGAATDELSLHRVGIAFKPRKVRYH